MNRILTIQTIKTSIFLLLIIGFLYLPIRAQDDTPEKIKSVKTVTGKFIRFVVGDYVHPEIRKSNGKIESYWLGGGIGLDYFLAVNRGKTMIFTYEVVDTYIEQNGGPMIIERIKSAKIGSLTFEKWWKALKKKYSVNQIEKKYAALVGKYTKN
jgi:hypothetical protein